MGCYLPLLFVPISLTAPFAVSLGIQEAQMARLDATAAQHIITA